MSDPTTAETAKTRRLLAAISLMALLLAGLVALQAACGKKSENAAAAPQATAPPAPTPTPDPGEPPSFKETAVAGEGSFSAIKAPFEGDVDEKGRIWILDSANSRVRLFDRNGGFFGGWGGNGDGPTSFKTPEGLATSRDGLYVADTWNHRIQVFDKDGKYVSSWDVPWLAQSWQARLETDQNGILYVTNPGGAEVVSFDRSGAPGRHWNADDSGEKMLQPMGLAIDRKQGILYVMDGASHKVLKISLSARKAG